MLLLGGAGGYFIAKGEGGGGSGAGTSAAEPKSKPTSQLTSRQSIKETHSALESK